MKDSVVCSRTMLESLGAASDSSNHSLAAVIVPLQVGCPRPLRIVVAAFMAIFSTWYCLFILGIVEQCVARPLD